MPILKNPRHERFAQTVASGKSEMSAFAEAGYSAKSAKQNAHRMSENEGVKARIAELQARAEANCDLTRAEVVRILGRLAQLDPAEKVEVGANNELTELLKRLRGEDKTRSIACFRHSAKVGRAWKLAGEIRLTARPRSCRRNPRDSRSASFRARDKKSPTAQ